MTELSNEAEPTEQVKTRSYMDNPELYPEFRRGLAERFKSHPRVLKKLGLTMDDNPKEITVEDGQSHTREQSHTNA